MLALFYVILRYVYIDGKQAWVWRNVKRNVTKWPHSSATMSKSGLKTPFSILKPNAKKKNSIVLENGSKRERFARASTVYILFVTHSRKVGACKKEADEISRTLN